MTKRQRLDKGTRFASVITGLRLEPELAQALRSTAVERASGNVAEMARYLIATTLGISVREANEIEERAPRPHKLCGLALSSSVHQLLSSRAATLGLTVTGCARHLLRVGLGLDEAESLRREETFASLAQALREVREAHRS